MPYTPPSSYSPAGSKPHSPAPSRSQAYIRQQENDQNAPESDATSARPRSTSSSRDYLHKHRRSPSITKTPPFVGQLSTPNDTPVDTAYRDEDDEPYSNSDNVKHSPPPPVAVKGTTISPPDSSQNSSDDEASNDRGRIRDIDNLAELQAAIRIIEQHRGGSPNRQTSEDIKNARRTLGLPEPRLEIPAAVKPFSSRPPLSTEARKISHSRSSTAASAFESFPRNKFDSPSLSISDNDFEEVDGADLPNRPPLVRKKSGEPVRPALRPSSVKRRPSSMPGTPTYSKAVHFNNELEQVRHFLQVDRPLAVSAGSSPVDNYESELEFPFGNGEIAAQAPPWEWELQLSNFPRESLDRSASTVKVERVYLSSDKRSLLGAVAVRNIAFHKLVVARFTLDYWKTTSEVTADFNTDVRRRQVADGCDRFLFSIKLEDLANLETKTMFFCVRYNVAGQEFWDNNAALNYQVDFKKKAMPQNGKQGLQGASPRPLTALPRSKPTAPNAPRPRSFPSMGSDDFASSLASPYEFSSFPQPSAQIIGDSPIRFKKPAPEVVPDAPGRRTTAAGQAFGNRYDFGASLSAAIQAASNTLGDRSGIKLRDEVKSAPAKQLSFSPKPTFEAAALTGETTNPKPSVASEQAGLNAEGFKASANEGAAKPIALTTEKPSMQSTSYHELLDKYCFFGSGKPSALPARVMAESKSQSQSKDQVDGACEVSQDSVSSSPASPPSPPEVRSLPQAEGLSFHQVTSSRNSRSVSPAPVSRMGSRTGSPVSFGYPYHQPMQNAFFGETHALTAIRG